ncbi:isoprenyl transferase [Demequina zhanjiangensis]|uniref:Isoprenyl transferase n=1 Tax=Demequina zhanjiangensis TaxID=3051659 RepID=A0ABT8G573_9MICO|nr:isoprenyl transferase [Demequina sp. SYSU T00b26]MDN4474084.1 isoprenyl transferase [Demequina sp. SYSU T00b26]
MGLRSLLYGVYERQLVSSLRDASLPRHIGVILDGNRRWAKTIGAPAAHGHQKGADKITEVLEWSQEAGVEVVTLWLLSTDNLDRDQKELAPLLEIICSAVEALADDGRWRLRHVGDATLLPADSAGRIAAAVARTEGATGVSVNVAVGYGGRHEITDAVRSYLRACDAEGLSLAEAAERLKVDHIEDHLYTKGQPDPDLVIRTSGEQRLSGFLMWQSAHTEFYFCEAYWPAFRRVDFLRALRDYALRERRLGR